jgi:hypothetical protein
MTGTLVYLWLEAKRQWRNREVLISSGSAYPPACT